MEYQSHKYVTKVIQKTICSDQRMRSIDNQTAHRYSILLAEPIRNVTSISLSDCYIPKSEYVIDSHNDTIDYLPIKWNSENDFTRQSEISIVIPHGFYTIDTLLEKLNDTNINPNLIFGIFDQSTGQILVTLQQDSSQSFNAFQLLFGTGKNKHKSAARVLGFESGINTEMSTAPQYFTGLLENDSNTLITTSSIALNLNIEYVIENNISQEVGLVTSAPISNDLHQISLSDIEYSYLKNNHPNEIVYCTLNSNFDYQIYNRNSFIDGILLYDNSHLYIYHNSDDVSISNSFILINRRGNFYLNSAMDINSKYIQFNRYSVGFLEKVIHQRNLNNEIIDIKYLVAGELNSSHSLHLNCVQFFELNHNSQNIFFKPHIDLDANIQYYISPNCNPNSHLGYPIFSSEGDYSSLWESISFTFTDNCKIYNSYHTYNGNIRNNIILGGINDYQSSLFHAFFEFNFQSYNSLYPNCMPLGLKAQSILIFDPDVINLQPVNVVYNCNNDGSIEINSANSFSVNYGNSIYNCVIPFSYSYTHSSVNINGQNYNISSPNIVSIGSTEFGLSSPLYFVLGDDTQDIQDITLGNTGINITLTQYFSSEVYIESIDYSNNSIIIYSSQSPSTHFYLYNLYFNSNSDQFTSTNCYYNSVSSTDVNSFSFDLNSLGYYKVELTGDFHTKDVLTFRYINDKITINCHHYSNSLESYIIHSFSHPLGDKIITINNSPYSLNSTFKFNNFPNCNSPVIVIDNYSYYFQNCVFGSIVFVSVNSNENENNSLFYTFIPNSNSIHHQMKKYHISYTGFSSNIFIENSFEYTFQGDHFEKESETIIFQGLDSDDNSFGNSLLYTIYNKVKYYNSPFIFTNSVNELHFTSVGYYINSVIEYSTDFFNSIIRGDTHITLYDGGSSLSYSIFPDVPEIKLVFSNNSYTLGYVDIIFGNSYEIFTLPDDFNENIHNERKITWRSLIEDPEFGSENTIAGYLSDDSKSIILNKSIFESFHDYIMKLTLNNIDYLMFTKPSTYSGFSVEIERIVIDQVYNIFHAFQYKQLISPYKYDLENTPIVQIICEKIGSTIIEKPIGVYNFIDLKSCSNKIEFPIISKLSTLSFSLKRRDTALNDSPDDVVYYQWNGMEHTLIISIEYIDIVNIESKLILS